MPERVEMVVGGRRRAVHSSDLTSHSSWGGFVMEALPISPYELPDHWLPHYVIGLQFLQGTAKRFYFEQGRLHTDVIANGNCIVSGPREVRRFRVAGDGHLCMVAIEPVVLQEMTAGSPARDPLELIRTQNGEDPVLRNLVLRLRANVAAGVPAGPLFGESLCLQLAEALISRYSIGRVRLDAYRGGLSEVCRRRTLDFIEENLGVGLDGSSIAAVAGLSKYHFGKAFKHTIGMTLHRYVLARRLRRAQELLVRSDLPLADIAATTGFSSQSHLTALFAVRLGISPQAYRQQKRRVYVSFHTATQALRGALPPDRTRHSPD